MVVIDFVINFHFDRCFLLLDVLTRLFIIIFTIALHVTMIIITPQLFNANFQIWRMIKWRFLMTRLQGNFGCC